MNVLAPFWVWCVARFHPNAQEQVTGYRMRPWADVRESHRPRSEWPAGCGRRGAARLPGAFWPIEAVGDVVQARPGRARPHPGATPREDTLPRWGVLPPPDRAAMLAAARGEGAQFAHPGALMRRTSVRRISRGFDKRLDLCPQLAL